MKRLSILFLGRNGAGPKYSFEMTNALLQSKSNIEFQVIIPNNIDNLEDWEVLEKKYGNIRIHYVNTYSGLFSFLWAMFNIFNYVKIASTIKDFNPNWIYMPMGSLLNPGIFFFLQKYKKIYTLHDPILHEGEQSWFVETIRKIEIRNSNKIILLNNYFKEKTSQQYMIPEDNILVIPHAAFLRETEPKYFDNYQYKMLFLGRIEKYKGIELLLDTFKIIRKSIPNLQLTIAGKGNIEPYSDKINENSSNGGDLKIISKWLTEYDIEKLLDETDFVILPYIDASQSGVIPVAFGNGRTVLATNVGALSEQIPEGLGFLAEPNVASITEKINEIYKMDTEDFLNLNKATRKFALENLTWSQSVYKLMDFLK